VLKAENIPVGDCGITIQDIEGEELPELGYHIKKEFCNMGYATKACRACINYAFGNLRHDSVCSYMRIDNYPSARSTRSRERPASDKALSRNYERSASATGLRAAQALCQGSKYACLFLRYRYDVRACFRYEV
jgi:hypothetical protein